MSRDVGIMRMKKVVAPDAKSAVAFRAGRSLAAFLCFNEQQRRDGLYRLTTPPWNRNPLGFIDSPRRSFPAGRFFDRWLKRRNWDVDYPSLAQLAAESRIIDAALRILWLRVLTHSTTEPEPGIVAAAVVELMRVVTNGCMLTPAQFVVLAGEAELPVAQTRLNNECIDMWEKRLKAFRRHRSKHYLAPHEIVALARKVLRHTRAEELLGLGGTIDRFVFHSFANWSAYRALHRARVEKSTWVDGKRTSLVRGTILKDEDHELWTARARAGLLRHGITL